VVVVNTSELRTPRRLFDESVPGHDFQCGEDRQYQQESQEEFHLDQKNVVNGVVI
jgi:hypothetical protein